MERERIKAPSKAALHAVILLCFLAPILGASEWQSFPGGKWQSLDVPSEGRSGFQLLNPAETGVLFTNTLSEEQGATNRTLYNGSGVATGDINGDGLPDIALAGIGNRLELFKNVGGGRFTNATRFAGLAITNQICRGVVLADVTGDGALDLLLTVHGGVRYWRNNGDGTFREMTVEAGTASPFGSFTLALADVDGNGSVDLYVANNRSEDIRDRGEVQLQSVRGQLTVPPALRNRLAVVNGQVLEYGEPDALLLNDGTGHFREANWARTFSDAEGQALKGAPLDWGLSATFRDLNNDGAPDLYVCNDFWTPDRIWLNTGEGKFRAASATAFRQISGSSMGVDIRDLDFDGHSEIFVVDMLSRFPSWQKRQKPAQPPMINPPGLITNRPQILRNTLFRARGDGTYEEMANYSGLAAAEWAWQPIFIDVDLDGHPDLLITSGHAHDVQDRDAGMAVQTRQRNYQTITNAAERQRIFSGDLLANMRLYPKLATPIVAFRNRGSLKFDDYTETWGTAQPGIHHGIATADFDGDGDLDLVVNNMNEPAALYRNESPAPRVALRLRGHAPNTQALGALVTLRGGAVPIQRQEIIAGGRYLSGCDPFIVFAAGTNTTALTLEIRWRNGKVRTVTDIRPNRLYEISEDPALDRAPVPEQTRPPSKWFMDASAAISHSHHDALYDDFLRQPLLPRRLSQPGPGVAWCDLDADGWEDLAIGTGAGGKVGVFRNNQKGGFVPWTNAPFNQPVPRDTTTLLSMPLPKGKTALLAGLANYEDGLTNAACLFQFDPEAGGPRAILKDLPGSVGPLALADYDGDGELDLFVGARVKAGRWPEAGGSILLKGQGGAFVADSENTRIIGSSNCAAFALWTDLDNDGDPELILAGEWSPIRIFRNVEGRLENWDWPVRRDGNAAEQLSTLSGLWAAVQSGDFDGDGKMDLIAGNWGENGEEKASREAPLVLFSGEWASPSLALLETVYSTSAILTPSRALPDLVSSLPFLMGRFASHHAFSELSANDVLGSEKSKTRQWKAITLKSTVLLNRGTHFEERNLPREAQLAPVFGICIADFNQDDSEDIFLAQNFFATRPGVPRLDAGRGLLLQGDGKGGFRALDGAQSGIEIDGEQRGAAVADFDHDGKPDFVVTQNGAATRLLRNQSARRGLRVKLLGPRENPHAVGAVIRLRCGSYTSAAREIRAGSGYWSQDAPAQIIPYPPKDLGDQLVLEVQFSRKTHTKEISRTTDEVSFKLTD